MLLELHDDSRDPNYPSRSFNFVWSIVSNVNFRSRFGLKFCGLAIALSDFLFHSPPLSLGGCRVESHTQCTSQSELLRSSRKPRWQNLGNER
jgi:hypothetical protein